MTQEKQNWEKEFEKEVVDYFWNKKTITGTQRLSINHIEKIKDFIRQTINQERENLLNDYSDWLHKKGYIDADYYAEEPKAVEEYLKHLSTKIKE